MAFQNRCDLVRFSAIWCDLVQWAKPDAKVADAGSEMLRCLEMPEHVVVVVVQEFGSAKGTWGHQAR